ncbi:RNA polymerase sigma-70 factor, ECF subfamily [Micromonospora purpureochromogenes]|uniref:RNA polymerase sigma-70 factor, ECF subfamily n=1 Tax=Micromonospora purpureochromogenes TaxID=47872 RepID=A0A1C4ZRB4_9ACTN|nr:RNA polymerase sigma factor [Micromonospora purpureochromogenes]SCF35344.1 RNA polymerase sigma-70 factor, ECF subfamily [Micromonospora purpureochromogenes]
MKHLRRVKDVDVGAVTDAAIIARSVQEPEIFSTIFDRHAPYIHRYLARRLGVPAADDLVAETFLAAFRRRDRFDITCPNARPWLYGIATNVVGQHRRTEEREYRLRQAYVPATSEASHADRVATVVTAQSLRRLLLDALAMLSDGDRDVLLLIAWEELTYDEVAAALAIPVGTVRSRLNRARRLLREQLGGEPAGTIEEALSNG